MNIKIGLIILLFVHFSESYMPCRTTENIDGHCQPLKTCHVADKFSSEEKSLKQNNSWPVILCGYHNGEFYVCCEEEEEEETISEPPKTTTSASISEISHETCKTEDDEEGGCIPLRECYELLQLAKSQATIEDKEFVKKRKCGFKNGKVQVCCLAREKNEQMITEEPETTTQKIEGKSCRTLDNEQGQCTLLKDCHKLKQYAKPPITNEKRSFLLNRKCDKIGNKVYVCCLDNEINEAVTVQPTTERVSVSTTTKASTFSTTTPQETTNRIPEMFPSPPRCGLDVSDRIFGGNVTKIDEFPWLALLRYKKPDGYGYHCGGSLINDRYVLTAGHCISKVPDDWNLVSVRLGEWDMSTDPDCDDSGDEKICAPSYVEYRISEKIVHNNYHENSKNQHNDIALLRTVKKVKITEFISPICLPFPDFFKNNDLAGYSMDVSGWGRTEKVAVSDKKLKVTLKTYPEKNCKRAYAANQLTIINKQLCAGGEEGKDSCDGDSGGPLMVLKSDENPAIFLVGVVSYGPGNCGTQNKPGIYTKVSEYLDWIDENVRK